MRAGFALLFILPVVVGCSFFGDEDDPPRLQQIVRLDRITLVMASDANDSWPVSVELVRLADPALVHRLLSIETMAWFAKEGNNFRQANPEVHYNAWEIVPGTAIGPFDVEVDGDVEGVLFCGARSVSAPIRFGRDGDVIVQIDNDGCTLSGGKPSGESGFWPWEW